MSRQPRFGPQRISIAVDCDHGYPCGDGVCWGSRPVHPSDPVRDALVLAAGEIRALFAWGDRVGPSGWAHVRQNFDGLRAAVDNALDAIDARGIR